MTHSTKDDSPGDWRPCPAGTLRRLSDHLHAHERRRSNAKALRAAGAAVAVLLVLVAGNYAFHGRRQQHSGLTCRQCAERLADFHAGRLDDELASQVQQHLNQCPECREKYQQMFAAILPSPPATPTTLAALTHFLNDHLSFDSPLEQSGARCQALNANFSMSSLTRGM